MAHSDVKRTESAAAWRIPLFLGLVLAEVLLASLTFRFGYGPEFRLEPIWIASRIAQAGILASLAFGLAAWPIRGRIARAWSETESTRAFGLCLALNLCLFAGLLAARYLLSVADGISLAAATAYGVLLLATGASLALVLAPPLFWRKLLQMAPVELAIAAAAAAFIMFVSGLAQDGWTLLASATLDVSAWLLNLYESGVEVDRARALLGIGDFRVEIAAGCSGYEGVGLVAAFVSIYLWMFRRDLAFPNAVLLLPVGIVAVWLLNAVRIAALVSIGAHFSPDVAVNGFHSQAGWIMFLAVTIALIAVSHRIPYFRARAAAGTRVLRSTALPATRSGPDLALVFLAPFMALMATSVLAFTVAPYDRWLYPVKVVAVLAVLYIFRDAYLGLIKRVSPVSVAVGAIVGVVWIATDPAAGSESPLGLWLATLPASIAVLWVAFRALGSVVLVPVAEELAFRGYLHRALIAKRFESIEPGHFTLLAFVVSSAAFGLMHQRWLSAALAGAAYAILMYRTNRLSDPIAAHMTSNAIIVLWAIAAGQWSLL